MPQATAPPTRVRCWRRHGDAQGAARQGSARFVRPAFGAFELAALFDGDFAEHLLAETVVVGLEELFHVVADFGGQLEFLFLHPPGDFVNGTDQAARGLGGGKADVGIHGEQEVLLERHHAFQILPRAGADEALDFIQPRKVERPVRLLLQVGAERLQIAKVLAQVPGLLEEAEMGWIRERRIHGGGGKRGGGG